MRMLRASWSGRDLPGLLLQWGRCRDFPARVVVPRFAVLLEGASKKLPLASQLLLGWGKSVAAIRRCSGGSSRGQLLSFGMLRAARSGWQIPGLRGPAGSARGAAVQARAVLTDQRDAGPGRQSRVCAIDMGRRLLSLEDQLLSMARAADRRGSSDRTRAAQAQIADTVALRGCRGRAAHRAPGRRAVPDRVVPGGCVESGHRSDRSPGRAGADDLHWL